MTLNLDDLPLVLGVLMLLCGYLVWVLVHILEKMKTTANDLKNSKLLSGKFDKASKLLDGLGGLQEEVKDSKTELLNLMYYVKKLRAELQTDHQNTKRTLADLGKLKAELQVITASLHGDMAQLLKILKTHDIQLSRRAHFVYGDEDGDGGPAQQLLPPGF